jgi:hypothetical protein
MSPILLRPIVASPSWVPMCFSVFVDEQLLSSLLNAQVLSLLHFNWCPVFVSSYLLVVALENIMILSLCSLECLFVSSAVFSILYGYFVFDDAVRSLIRLNDLVCCDLPIRLLVVCVNFVLENISFPCLGSLYRLTFGIAMVQAAHYFWQMLCW